MTTDDRLVQAEHHLRAAEASLARLAAATHPEAKAKALDDALRSLALAQTTVGSGTLPPLPGAAQRLMRP